MLQNNDRYRIEGGYDQPSQWIIQTKIAPVECRIISDNVASIYSNYFYDQVKRRFVFLKIILFYLVSL
jgi:hypothetical protein